MKRTLPLILLAACAPKPPPEAPVVAPEPEGPSLVVLLVVDQLPTRLLDQVLPYVEHGLDRLVGEQAYVATTRFPQAITFTCPGHATLATGAAPSVNGIVSNDWVIEGERIYCSNIDFLRAEGIGDVVAEAGGRVVSLSQKDRSAVMMGGRSADLVGWYDRAAEAWSDSWANEAAPVADYLELPWEALHPDIYARYHEDEQDHEGTAPGMGNTFPHPTVAEAGIRAFPFHPASGTALTDLLIAAIDRYELGQGDRRDLLALSYSHVDYIGHVYTPESWEALDNMLRLDQEIGRLLEHLDQAVGAGRYTVILSADHGASPPTLLRADVEDIEARADAALEALELPTGVIFEDPSLWLPAEIEAEQRDEAARAAAAAVTEHPAIAHVYAWRADGVPDDAPFAQSVRYSLDDERSGDLYVLLENEALYNFPGSEYKGTSHGTPYDYDQVVPLLAWGAGISPGRGGESDIRQIAPTISALLGLRAPAQAELEPVREALK